MLYIQHGYGKSNKIETAIANGTVQGIILGPKSETPNKLYDYINTVKDDFEGVDVLIDPQIYLLADNEVIKTGKLNMYPYYLDENIDKKYLSMPKNIQTLVDNCLNFQLGVEVSKIISPSILLNDFDSRWSQIALSLYNESISFLQENSTAENLLLTIVVDENAFKSQDALNDYLDEISLMDVRGFYVIINRKNDKNPLIIESELLANIMYFCYNLSVTNGYEVILGYTDLIGLPIYCSGITAISTGWFNTLRRFAKSDYLPREGGHQPNKKYLSDKLLNYIVINPEIKRINDSGKLDEVLSGTDFDKYLLQNIAGDSWISDISNQHNWEIIYRILDEIDCYYTVPEKVEYFLNRVNISIELYNKFNILDTNSKSTHLPLWKEALETFNNMVK